MFDQRRYWIDRHEQYRDDPRSVGNLGRSLEENRRGEALLHAQVGAAAALLKPAASVLDVGCGYGRIAGAFCDAGYDYTGIDISPVAIESACAREPRGAFHVGSALDVDLDRRFDVVCVLFVFVHFVDDRDWRRLIDRLADLVAPGGALLFADEFPARIERTAAHVAHRPLRAYRERFRRLGMPLEPGFPAALASALGLPRRNRLPFHLARKPTG
jgi:SAM-dependent methyltransferase